MLYIFQHIPKTAGTSFTEGYLATAFGDALEVVPGFGSENHAALQRLARTPNRDGGRTRIVAGHGAGSMRAVAPGARQLTLVRDPIARLISAHRHYLRTPKAARDTAAPDDFLDFALDEPSRDVQARSLLGEHYGDLDRLNDAEVESLLAERFFLIGDSEKLPQFIVALSRLADFPLVLFADRLRAPEDRFAAPSPEVMERICDFHRRDLRVCALASKVFEAQTAGLWTAAVRRETEIYEAALEAFGDNPDDDLGRAWMPPAAVRPIASVDVGQFMSHDVWRPAEATPSAGGARVTTGPAVWSYAAELPLPEGVIAHAGPLFLQVELRVDKGRIGLAVCSGEDRAFVSESFFEHIRHDASATFLIRGPLSKPALMVRNASESGTSAVEIKAVRMLGSAERGRQSIDTSPLHREGSAAADETAREC